MARQRTSKTVDLFGRRSRICRATTDNSDAVADLNCTLRGLLDVARNFLRRRTLLLDGRRDRR